MSEKNNGDGCFFMIMLWLGIMFAISVSSRLDDHTETLACVEHATYATEPCRCLPVDAYPEGSPLRGLAECEIRGAE